MRRGFGAGERNETRRTCVHLWKFPDRAQYLPHQPICTAKRRVDLGSDTDQPTGYRKREVIALGVQRDDLAKDRFTSVPSRAVLGHDTGSDLDFLAEVEDTGEDGASGDAAFEFVDFGTGFVDIERTDDDEARVRGEISDRDGDAFDDVLVDGVDVIFQLGRYRYDGR